MTKDEALKLALEELLDLPGFRADIDNAITAIKEALAQPEQEPVAWLKPEWKERICPEVGFEATITSDHPRDLCWIPLYPHPPKRKPLTNFNRFNGVDIQFRKSGTDWPMPYRVQVHANKNERYEDRTTVFCHTLNEAIEAAQGIKEQP